MKVLTTSFFCHLTQPQPGFTALKYTPVSCIGPQGTGGQEDSAHEDTYKGL